MESLTYRIEDGGFTHFVSWSPENEPETIRLEVHPQAPLKGAQLAALSEALTRATGAVEQPSLKARRQALLKAGFKSDLVDHTRTHGGPSLVQDGPFISAERSERVVDYVPPHESPHGGGHVRHRAHQRMRAAAHSSLRPQLSGIESRSRAGRHAPPGGSIWTCWLSLGPFLAQSSSSS